MGVRGRGLRTAPVALGLAALWLSACSTIDSVKERLDVWENRRRFE